MSGYLELILGPMFSGKTTYLINTYHYYLKNYKNVAVINYSGDTRYHDKMLSSHDHIMIPCTFISKINDVLSSDEIINSDAVLINEGQFFEDLFESVIYLVEKLNKRVYICGLDGDYKRMKFGTILDLVPMCDKITKLKSRCEYCKGSALFSHRITNEQEQVVIGTNNYVPLCRPCFVKENYSKIDIDNSEVEILLDAER